MSSHTVMKCIVEGSQEVFRLRLASPLTWEVFHVALSDACGPRAAAKYEDEEGDWCTLAENTFEDFLVSTQEKALVKLCVTCSGRVSSVPPASTDLLPIPNGVIPNPGDACGPKPFLAALQQLGCGSQGGWTASNVCTLMLAFLPTLKQRALRKMEKMNMNGFTIVDSMRDVLDQLSMQLNEEPGLEEVTEFLQKMQEGTRVHEFGKFVIDLLRSLQPLPFSKQKELLTPALHVLLQGRPNFFTEIFGEQTAQPSQTSRNAHILQLPSGRCIPVESVLTPDALTAEQKVHLACLGAKSVPKNSWANLRISEKGVVGIGGVGAFASFKLRREGENANGVQRVSLESCGGGGFLCSQGDVGFSGGPAGPKAIFLLKPLGDMSVGEQKVGAVSLLIEDTENCALGVGPCGGIKVIRIDKAHDVDSIGAFLILDSSRVQKPLGHDGNGGGAIQEAVSLSSQADACQKHMKESAKGHGKAVKQVTKLEKAAKQAAKIEEKVAKVEEKAARQAAKVEGKAAKQVAKIEDKAAKQAARLDDEGKSTKIGEEAGKQAAKLEEKAAKQVAKVEEKAAKQSARLSDKQAKCLAKAVEQAGKKAEQLARKEAQRASKLTVQATKQAEKDGADKFDAKDVLTDERATTSEAKTAGLEVELAEFTDLSEIVDGGKPTEQAANQTEKDGADKVDAKDVLKDERATTSEAEKASSEVHIVKVTGLSEIVDGGSPKEQAVNQTEKDGADKVDAKDVLKDDRSASNEAKKARSEIEIVKVTCLSEIVDGAVVFIEAKSGRLRINLDGSIDTKGGWGKGPAFIAHLKEQGGNDSPNAITLALQHEAMPERYLRMPEEVEFKLQNLSSDGLGLGQADSVFEIATISNPGQSGYTFRPQPEGREMAGGMGCNVQLYMKRAATDSVVGSDSDWLLEDSCTQMEGVEKVG